MTVDVPDNRYMLVPQGSRVVRSLADVDVVHVVRFLSETHLEVG